MKVSELFESEEKSFEEIAKDHDFKYREDRESFSGKKYDVYKISKVSEIEDLRLNLEYTINKETSSWLFTVALEDDEHNVELADGSDKSSFIKHIKKKKKISSSKIDELFLSGLTGKNDISD